MKKGLPSPSHKNRQVGRTSTKWLLSICLALWCSIQLQAQVPSFGTSECNCFGDTSEDNPIFQDRITIQSSTGDTWTVESVSGLFVPGSDPLQTIPIGTVIGEIGTSGTYILDAIRGADMAFALTVSDGTTSYDLDNRHFCYYPIVELLGDSSTCIGSIEDYSLNMSSDQVDQVNWTVTGGTILFETETMISVQWPEDAGTGTVQVTGEASTNSSGTGTFCDFDETMQVQVMSEEPIVLACNNSLNITMGPSCEVNLRPTTLLQDMQFSDASYDLELRDIDADTLIPTTLLNGRYLDKVIEVKVIHECSGNSCWGFVTLEDKSMPSLTCGDTVTVDCNEAIDPLAVDLPIPNGSLITQIDENSFFVEGFDQCGGLTLDFYDEVNSNLCSGAYASVINRRWQATDEAGNTSDCTQVIRVRRATLDDIVFPPIYDDVLGATGGNPSLDACGNWPQLDSGYPAPEFTGSPMGTFCLNVQVTYEDQLIGGCSDVSFKIKRRWQVSDLCGSGRDTVYNQIITVADNTPPLCNAPNEFGASTNTQACDAMIDVPPPTVIFECSEWDYQVSYKLVDDSNDPFSFSTTDGVIRLSDGTYRITNVPAGQDTVWIIYTIMDECGNVSECFTEVGLIDDEEPVPVCDRYTFIAVNEQGMAFAGPSAFDDGSYDNCDLDSMDVRRMDDACGYESDWRDKVKFCCEDIGDTVMVALRVWDGSGNSNQCMVEVHVQDNIPPVFTSLPRDITVNCTEDINNLDRYGTIEAEDVCGVSVTEEADFSSSRCGEGQVIRRFTATDAFGNTSTHEQTITLTNLDRFFINQNNPNDSRDDVVWPRDYSTNTGCLTNGLEPEDLPAAFGFPRTFENECSEVSVTHEDIVFQYVDQACYKILRQWTIIDFCQFNPFAPNDGGKWDYTQEIMVTNSTRPTILTGCDVGDATIASAGNCRAVFSLSATGSDDCTEAEDLEWTYRVDVGDDGTIDYEGEGSSFSEELDFLSVRVEWTVEDQCGNTSSCDQVFVIDDQKKPTPYCLSEIVTVLMETDGTVEIWASDFDNGSFDDCSDVIVSFSADTDSTAMLLTCDDVANGIEEMIPVEVWVTDASGNQDFCMATLTLQDNNDACSDNVGVIDSTSTSRVAIAGSIATEQNEPVDQVEVVIMANLQEFPAYEMTDNLGHYAFADLLSATDYRLEPVKYDDASKGVTTLDLVLIQRHILGMTPLSSPYRVIAADVNNSASVSGADVVALRKLILGITEDFEQNDPWRFVDAAQTFDDPMRPFPFKEQLAYQQVATDMAAADFVAVKIGDVNGSFSSSNINGRQVDNRSFIELQGDLVQRNGHQYLMVRSSEVSDLTGMQFTLKCPEGVEVLSVQSDILNISEDHVGWSSKRPGMLAVSWSHPQAVDVAEGEVLMMFEVLSQDNEVPVISDDLLEAEAYLVDNNELTVRSIAYSTGGGHVASAYRLYQNVPNPFDATTEIAFELGEAGPATLSIYDINGRLIYRNADNYDAGLHSIKIDVDALQATGILYYQLDSRSYTASKKMVVIR